MTLWTVAHQPLCPWDSPGKNTGVGSHSVLQGIFLTQGSNSGLLHCSQILYHLSHQGSPISYIPIQNKKLKKRKENVKVMKHKEILRNCVSQIGGNYGDATSKCTVGSWHRKRTWGENQGKSSEVCDLVNGLKNYIGKCHYLNMDVASTHKNPLPNSVL